MHCLAAAAAAIALICERRFWHVSTGRAEDIPPLSPTAQPFLTTLPLSKRQGLPATRTFLSRCRHDFSSPFFTAGSPAPRSSLTPLALLRLPAAVTCLSAAPRCRPGSATGEPKAALLAVEDARHFSCVSGPVTTLSVHGLPPPPCAPFCPAAYNTRTWPHSHCLKSQRLTTRAPCDFDCLFPGRRARPSCRPLAPAPLRPRPLPTAAWRPW